MLKSVVSLVAGSLGLVAVVSASPAALERAARPDRPVSQARDAAALLHGRTIFTLAIGVLAAGEAIPDGAPCSSLPDAPQDIEGMTRCRVYSDAAVHLCYEGGEQRVAQVGYGRKGHAQRRPGCDAWGAAPSRSPGVWGG